MFNLAGKCAVVIGGTSGIGKAISLGLASEGANVVASSRSQTAINALAIVSRPAAAKLSVLPRMSMSIDRFFTPNTFTTPSFPPSAASTSWLTQRA